MPAVTIDASVVDGSNTRIHANPIYPVQLPVTVPAELVGAVNSPVDIGSISSRLVGAPVTVASLSVADVAIPVDITELAPIALSIPVDITEESSIALSVPNAITPIAADPESPPFALNHARILYENLLVGSTSSTDNGTNPSFALIPNTAQRWTTSVNSFLKFTLPVNQDIDTVCIGAHNLSAGGYNVTVFYRPTIGGTLTAFTTSKTPTNDNALMFHRSSTVSAKTIEVYLTAGTGEAFIGSVYAGVALQMQRPFFGGHTPAVLARQADYYSSMSESGNFIGVEVRRRALESDASWKNLTDTWYRQYFVPFLASAEILPFYFAWNLLQYPNDVAYCKNITNVAPSYSGQRDLMTVGIPLVGIA